MAGSGHGTWFRIDDESSIGAVRRAASRLAGQIGLSTGRAGEAAILVTEVATNLHRHAENGSVQLRVVRTEERAGIGVIAVDNGPGMADALQSGRDGYSTGGTLGIGLGAIERLASWSETVSAPKVGTVVAFDVWEGDAPARPRFAALTRPMTGEEVCGDDVSIRHVDGRVVVLVVDGLGHGPLAATAAAVAVRAFDERPYESPARAVDGLHRALQATRGAALAVADIDGRGKVRYAGVGNISGWIVDADGGRRGMMSMPGIAGHQLRRVQQMEYDVTGHARVVLHSDGLTEKWSPSPALVSRDPIVSAAILMRDAGIRHDDASVLVAETPCTS